MKGWFHRNECDTCGGCEQHHIHAAPKACNTCGDTCNECGGHKFLDRLRGWFKRDCDECSTCSDCGAGPAAGPGRAPEPLKKAPTPEPPKKMPDAKQTSILIPQAASTGGTLIVE
jgi:hypothetical protein